jgi:BRK domain
MFTPGIKAGPPTPVTAANAAAVLAAAQAAAHAAKTRADATAAAAAAASASAAALAASPSGAGRPASAATTPRSAPAIAPHPHGSSGHPHSVPRFIAGVHSHVSAASLPPCCRAALPPCCIKAGMAPASLAPRPRYSITPVSAAATAATIAAATAAATAASAAGFATPVKSTPGGATPKLPTPIKLPIPIGSPRHASTLAPGPSAGVVPSPIPSTAAAAAVSAAAVASQANALAIAAASAAAAAGIAPSTPVAVARVVEAVSPYTYGDGDHVTIWNRLEKRKIAGNAAPLGKNLQKYLEQHPDCEVYQVQDHDHANNRSGRKRQRADGETAAGDHVAIWNKREKRKIAGNAAPLLKNLVNYLARRPDCEPYDFQDLELKKDMIRRRGQGKLSHATQTGPEAAAAAGAAAAAAAYAAAMSTSGIVATPALLSAVPLSASIGRIGAKREPTLVAADEAAAVYTDDTQVEGQMPGISTPTGSHSYASKLVKDEDEIYPLRNPATTDSLPEMGIDAWRALDSDFGRPTKTDLEEAAEFLLRMDTGDSEHVSLAIVTGPEAGELYMPLMNDDSDLAGGHDPKGMLDMDMTMDDDLDEVAAGIATPPPPSFTAPTPKPLSGC